jgi:replicative DNA helicase
VITESVFDLREQFDQTIRRLTEERDGMSIGFPDLEKYMDSGGFQGGQLITVIAKPKVGKTFLVSNAIHNLLGQNKKSLFISVEMNAYTIIKRMLRLELDCGYDGMKQAVLHEEERVRSIARAWAPYLMLVDMKDVDITQIERYVDDFGPDAVFVDYIQIVNAGQTQSEMDRVSKVAKGLADLAQVKNQKIFALSQTAKDDVPGWQMPSAASGKWSSDIHIASDVLVGMCRLDTNPSCADCDKGKVEIQILESRYGGSSPVVTYHYDENSTRLMQIDAWDSASRQGPEERRMKVDAWDSASKQGLEAGRIKPHDTSKNPNWWDKYDV